jgi:hypothetical protein
MVPGHVLQVCPVLFGLRNGIAYPSNHLNL